MPEERPRRLARASGLTLRASRCLHAVWLLTSARGQLDKTPAFICLCSLHEAPQSGRCVFKSRRVPVVTQLSIKTSPARRDFKEMLGHNNHFLITIMVGLDAVASGEAHRSKEFSTIWAPRDAVQSARRSREFSCKALAAWLTDSIAAYIDNLSASPSIITDSALAATVEAGRSIGARIRVLAVACGRDADAATLLVRVAVIWRNRLVHSQATNPISRELRDELLACRQEIASDYQGLDVARLLDSAGRSHAPTFKEVTSLVRAAHKFVEQVDGQLLGRSDLDIYVKNILSHYISVAPSERTSNVWGKDPSRRLASLVQICKQYGMMEPNHDTLNRTSVHLLQEISSWTPTQAKAELCATT